MKITISLTEDSIRKLDRIALLEDRFPKQQAERLLKVAIDQEILRIEEQSRECVVAGEEA